MPKTATRKQYTRPRITRDSKNLHVIPRANKWAVIAEGDSKVSKTFATQTEAIEEARKIAKDSGGQLVIPGRTGRIRERDSYSRDPFPPREPRKVLHRSAPPKRTRRKHIGSAI